MSAPGHHYVYGPVFSRRLGRSLGIDLVPFKTCTYDCVYCQLGRTTNKTLERKEYIAVDEVLDELDLKLAVGTAPDFITLAGSGEPTLNSGIGPLLEKIKLRTRIPVAVLTNGSLLWMPEIREALREADMVLPSLDAGDENLFAHVNRPHPDLGFQRMVDGLVEFRESFSKPIWLEVFLLAGVTGIPAEVEKIAALVRRIRPDRVQLNTVTRPPAEKFAFAVVASRLQNFRSLFDPPTEVIVERPARESDARNSNPQMEEDIRALLFRRPCTAEDIAHGLGLHINEVIKELAALEKKGAVVELQKNGQQFYTCPRGGS